MVARSSRRDATRTVRTSLATMRLDWELLVCGVRGHETYRPDETFLAERLQVDTAAGTSWRCLRCGSFVPGEPAGGGPADHAPEVPRGAALRDLVIMRLLALDRLAHFVVLLAAGIVVIGLRHSQDALRDGFKREMPLLEPIAQQLGWNIDDSRIVHLIEKSFTLSSTAIVLIGCAIIVYASLQGIEAVGLWLIKRWGEYFSVIVTSVFIPVEIYELTEKISVFKILVLLINLAAVVWLVWSKRLFGARGGAAAYHAEHSAESLLTVERAASAVPAESS
ncbi:hypothetical protein GOAMR_20_02500 [Gordonia amarae NBRC 15530]|uniref:DUF2127 domain-containing protein n=2 Tax=Gordonia amarae TaxID=36821 RepID=G7GM75_9ACTN|nr:hypothetical protein GOAMR_20_02500 [Gordonia amarae NBRC 15530]